MYKVNIVSKNFLDIEVEEEFSFNLNRSELLELEARTNGGLRKLINDLSDHHESKDLVAFMSTFIKASYGVLSPDGRRFDKNDDVWEDFYRTNAYDKLFMELITDDEKALRFISNVLPAEESQ